MRDDPHPELRCRCIARRTFGDYDAWPSSYANRCRNRATAEDGLCDHCRTPHQPGEKNCLQGICCFGADHIRTRVSDPREPCMSFGDESDEKLEV